MELPERFWNKVKMPDDIGECWLWTGGLDKDGYGKCWIGTRERRAYRASYVLVYGEIPTNLQLDHLCRMRQCVNPMHLEAVTQRENTMRGNTISARNAAKTHCPGGHEYSVENTYRTPRNGDRKCRTCHRERMRAYAARKRVQHA